MATGLRIFMGLTTNGLMMAEELETHQQNFLLAASSHRITLSARPDTVPPHVIQDLLQIHIKGRVCLLNQFEKGLSFFIQCVVNILEAEKKKRILTGPAEEQEQLLKALVVVPPEV